MTRAKRTTIRRRAGRSGLTLLAILFASSAVLRAVDGAGQAFAEEPEPTEHMQTDAEIKQRSTFASAARAVFDPEGISSLLEELQTRETAVAQREAALEQRLNDLALAEEAIADNLRALQAAEEKLEATLSLADGVMEADIARLTRVYESMKPKQAAALFETMDPTFAAGFLARMRPEAAAPILAGLSPESAYRISVLFAARHDDVPTR